MAEVLTAEQVQEWSIYYSHEPWGFEVEDRRHAVKCAVSANAFGAKVQPDVFTMAKKIPAIAERQEQAGLVAKLKRLFGAKKETG